MTPRKTCVEFIFPMRPKPNSAMEVNFWNWFCSWVFPGAGLATRPSDAVHPPPRGSCDEVVEQEEEVCLRRPPRIIIKAVGNFINCAFTRATRRTQRFIRYRVRLFLDVSWRESLAGLWEIWWLTVHGFSTAIASLKGWAFARRSCGDLFVGILYCRA